MILEMAALTIRDGRAVEFEDAFREATPLVAATPGFVDLQLQKCLERDDQYLLLIRWERIEDHEIGFRQGPNYAAWKSLLHHFYDPFPTVQHYGLTITA